MRLPATHTIGPVLMCVFLAGVIGCGGGPEMIPVEGVVTLDGSPVEGATVLFEPAIELRPTIAITDASGKFSMMAYLGTNEVAIAKGVDLSAGTGQAATAADEEAYLEQLETGEDDGSGEAYEEDTNQLDTPVKYASVRTSGITVDVQEGMAPVTLAMESGR